MQRDDPDFQEASRKLSIIMNISRPEAALRLFELGKAIGKVGQHEKKPRLNPIKVRPCLNCGNPKQHNNAYCSATCCKLHRESA